MDTGLEALGGASVVDRDTFRPVLYRLSSTTDRQRLGALLQARPHLRIHDELESQLEELVRALNPAVLFTPEALREAAHAHLNGTPADEYGVWVHYPWSDRLVHLLDEEEFATVRTDRNRNKITREEQLRLARLKIGVIGLSVGRSICSTLALERSIGELRIADLDRLDLSNLNRLRAGVHELGINKAVLVAREIAEIDPFLKVVPFAEGITNDNLDAFFTRGGKLDIVVDECDGVDVKIRCRQKARALGVAVVMDTSDRGLVDVERFDLESGRPLLHGLIDHLDPEAAARARTNEEKLPFLSPMAGLDTLTTRMKASMIELGRTVTTWPQLASSVTLGGALGADICRRIGLGQFTSSGRWWVDIEREVSDKAPDGDRADQASAQLPSLRLDELVALAAKASAGTPTSHPLTDAQARRICEAGAAAPSAGNMQPWRFLHADGRLFLFHDASRSTSTLDPDHLIDHIGLGTCLENMVLEAGSMHIALHASPWPLPEDTRLVAMLENVGSAAPTQKQIDLARQIGVRHTNRRKGNGRTIAAAVLDEMSALAGASGSARVHFISEKGAMELVGAVCGQADRIRILCQQAHHEFFQHELRWTHEEAERTRDGLDVATLELSVTDRTGLRIASDPDAVRLVRSWGGGSGLEQGARAAIRSAGALALVSVPTLSLRDRLEGARAAQRIWLAASSHDIAVHPMSAAIFLAHYVRHHGGREFSAEERRTLLLNCDQLSASFGTGGREPLFLLRLSHAEAASARSLRRPLGELLFSLHEQPA